MRPSDRSIPGCNFQRPSCRDSSAATARRGYSRLKARPNPHSDKENGMKRMKRSAFVARVGSIAVCPGIAAPALSQTLETVNVGSVNSVSDGPFLIADQKGYFR